MNGKVKWFDEKKGFGFIAGDDGNDVFVHHSGIAGPSSRRKNLSEGQKVEYEVTEGDKGPKAINVRGVCESRPVQPAS